MHATRQLALLAFLMAPLPAAGMPVSPNVTETYGNLPLAFEANRGQAASPAAFVARGPGYALQLMPSGMVLDLRRPTGAGSRVRLRLLGANRRSALVGRDELPGRVHYVVGPDPAAWQSDIPTYGRVEYDEVYPGIGLVVYGNQRRLEYDFVVAPGADPRAIEIGVKGVRRLEIAEDGALVLRTASGDLRQAVPHVYQDIEGTRRRVEGRYVLRGKHRVGFIVASYDRTRALVIDPVLTYSTYLGGTASEEALAIAVDKTGAAYVTGYTFSTDFPTRAATLPSALGAPEVFIAKLNASGTGLVYSTYLGGGGADYGYGIAVDDAGAAWVTGTTDGEGFPATDFIGLFGGRSAFVVKLFPGGGFDYSLVFSGEGHDAGNAIAVDASGAAYVAGDTYSPEFFPSTKVIGPAFNPRTAFVGKLNAAGSGFDYLLRFGGSSGGGDVAEGVAVDAAGSAYVTGYTRASDFPRTTTIGPGGGADVFVVKLNTTGTLLPYSAVFGGTDEDDAHAIAIDAGGAAYVTGQTFSTNFPTVGLVVRGFGTEAFVSKLNAAGTTLQSSTYLGGNGSDLGFGIAVDASGAMYVAGYTDSTDFPVVQPTQPTGGNAADAFVTKFGANGTDILFSTYLGSPAYDTAKAIAIDGARAIYVAGAASNTDEASFPTTPGAIQPRFAGQFDFDAFVTKITLTKTTGDACTLPNQPYTKLVFSSGPAGGSPSCGGPHLSPPPSPPLSGEVDDASGQKIGNLGLGCWYLGGGASEAGGIAAPEVSSSIGTSCNGSTLTFSADVGTGPTDCSRGAGPAKHCIGGSLDGAACSSDASCPSGSCQPDANCFFGSSLGIVAAGVPVCILPVVAADVEGALDATTGQTTLAVPLTARVYVTTVAKPCPLCTGGVCDSGARAGLGCSSNVQCPPPGSSFVSALPVTPVLTTDVAMKEHALGDLCPGQDSTGAIGKPAAVRVIENGLAPGDLTDKATSPATLAAVACLPATASVAANIAFDLPGPIAISLPGTMTLLPPPTTTTTATTTTSTSTTSTSTTATTSTTSSTTTSATVASTTMTSSTTMSSTTSSSTTTSSTTTSATSASSSSTSATASSSTTTSSGSSTTSTTMGPVCGNGQLDPGEVCDDGNQLDNDCCISGCQVLLRRGTLCGDPALGECDNGDTCDSSGHCLANPKPFGTQCTDDGEPCTADQCDGAGTCSHPPGNAGTVCYEATDPCEMDAVCDGESPDCRVDTSGCTGEVKPPPPQGKTIEVDCTAQDTVQGQASTCEAVGFVAGAGASAIVSNARASTIRPDPGEGSRVTKRKKRTLEPGPTGGGLTVLRGRLKLKLNATGRKLLNRQRVLNVSVHVAIHHGTTIRNIKRLVQLIR